MAAISYDLEFLFVCSGFEGSAADMRVMRECIDRGEFTVPPGKYYLVDAGYANTENFIAPYRGQRYHIKEYNTGERIIYANAQDIFKHRHAQLRNCVERAFGVLKKRFRILRYGAPYLLET